MARNKSQAVVQRKEEKAVASPKGTKKHQLLRYRRQKLRAIRRKGRLHSATRAGATFSRPVLRSHSKPSIDDHINGNYIINLKLLVKGMRKCSTCHEGPLSICNITKPPVRLGLGVVLYVKCSKCGSDCKIRPYETHTTVTGGPKAVSLNTRAVLAMIHTGQGLAHLNGILSVLGVGTLSKNTFQRKQKEVGLAVESVCKESCSKFLEEEKNKSTTIDDEGHKSVPISFDGAWQKRGKARNSTTGFGTIVGEATGKVIDYRVKSTRCRSCEAKIDGNASEHDCRKNHSGSAKSMEAEIAVECFNEAPNNGVKYTSYTADEDTTTESHIKFRVNYDATKKTDRNHAARTLGSRLYALQNSIKGLTPAVIGYIQKLFAYCVASNQGKPDELEAGLKTLVGHAFGSHEKCNSSWCGALKNPSTFRYKDLPGGKPLSGENLRPAIESCLEPFKSDEWIEKLANCGSSQINECVNGVIATKAPKTRHYGGSHSLNFRVASGICQYNEGLEYLTETTEKIGMERCSVTEKYVQKESRKRKREQARQRKWPVKRRRKELKKEKVRRKGRLEQKEGCTYESGVAVTDNGKVMTKGILNSTLNSLSNDDFSGYIETDTPRIETAAAPQSKVTQDEIKVFSFDIETTGLQRDSEIVQIACASLHKEYEYNSFAVPEKNISAGASKVNKLSTTFRNGQKVLLRESKVVACDVTPKQGLENFVNFLEETKKESNSKAIVLIAHNGNNFDFPILVNSLVTYSLFARFKKLDVMLLDSLKVFKAKLTNNYSMSLSKIYGHLFTENFDAHDANEDVKALSRCINKIIPDIEVFIREFSETLKSLEDVKAENDNRLRIRQRLITLRQLPLSGFMKEKIAKEGMDLKCLDNVFSSFGSRGLISLLAGPRNQEDSKAPRVTKNRKILTNITNFFESKKK